ncbi:transmembrane protein 223 [Hylobates moloch]|uniref:transmembrane protein 223 n=1 Tax=Hylobates moloch TaxID=81572 RepID=UPI001363DE03|nr:transmembrane protein 223 [Hylobates moloch]
MLYFVFCVLDWLSPPSPERVGVGAGPLAGAPREGGRRLCGRKPHPGSRLAMAAPWRRWPTGLLALLRPLPTCRPLQGATLQRDVLLFEHDRGRFFTILGLFCAGQGVFWASMAVAAVSRPPVPVQPLDAEVPNRGPFDLRSALWRYGLAVGCGAIGALVLGAGLLFSLRSVRSVVLRAGGQQVTLTTHAPFGLGAHFTVPLKQVSCMAHRGEVPAMLPLKVKGRRFYFLLDKAGHFPNTKLFDNTVGAYRSL